MVYKDYFRDEVKEEVEGQFYDWLIDSTCSNIERSDRITTAANNIIERVPFDLKHLHKLYLDKENDRLAKIRAEELARERKFEAERAERRSRRHLMRVSRAKRRLKEEIETKIFSKKSLEQDILGLKVVSFGDQDSEPKKFRTYGGLLYELWSVLSYAREAVNTKVEPPLEKFLVQDDDIKKFVVHFLSDLSVKEKSVRINIDEKYRAKFEEAVHHMETDLISFNESKEELIEGLIQHSDLVVSQGVEFCISHNRLEPMIYHWLIVNLLRIFFKSNDYKVTEDTAPLPATDQPANDDDKRGDNTNGQSGDIDGGNPSLLVPDNKLTKQGSQASNLHPHGDEQSAVKSAGTAGRRKSFSKIHKHGPEITDEDRRLEALKKKLDIVYVPGEINISSQAVAIFRVREGLNREALRPEVERRIHEEKERKRQEMEAIHDPKKHLDFHRKPYLLESYLAELKAKEEEQKRLEEEAEIKRKAEHIEQYYGEAYENDFENHDYEEGERAPTNINEAIGLENDREVLFIHRVNEGLYRKAIVDKLRETFKEIGLIKDIDLDKRILPLDREIEAQVLKSIVKDKDKLPIFDAEL